MTDWLSRIGPVPDPIADAEIDAISTPVNVMLPLTEEDEAIRTFARSPYLPTMDQWVEASKEIPKSDQAYAQRADDGLWYSIRGRRLYMPKYYGNRYYITFTPESTVVTLALIKHSGVHPNGSSGPSKAQMWRNMSQRVYHVNEFTHVRGSETVRVFGESWVQVFGAPEAVLVDKGLAFKSRTFQSYVYNYLAADLIYCGTGYPQGNTVNEVVHKGIESSIIARRQYDTTTSFDEMLGNAILAYNSTPHSFTGLSPYYMLFGKELILPGLQRYREGLSENVRQARISDNRVQAMHRAILGSDEGLRLYKAPALKPGDRVVYYLRMSEREGAEVDHG